MIYLNIITKNQNTILKLKESFNKYKLKEIIINVLSDFDTDDSISIVNNNCKVEFPKDSKVITIIGFGVDDDINGIEIIDDRFGNCYNLSKEYISECVNNHWKQIINSIYE